MQVIHSLLTRTNESTGRLYVGIFASALPSHATAQVRVLSALLQSVKSIPVADEK